MRAHVYIEDESQPVAIQFLIDSGSDSTILQPRDAVRAWLGYLAHDFEQDVTLTSLGGFGGMARIVLRSALVIFEDDSGDRHELRCAVGMMEPEWQSALPLPSVLGRDVLQHMRFTMDMRADVLSLEP